MKCVSLGSGILHYWFVKFKNKMKEKNMWNKSCLSKWEYSSRQNYKTTTAKWKDKARNWVKKTKIVKWKCKNNSTISGECLWKFII